MRWTLPPDRLPDAWFNVLPHLPTPLDPPLHPATREPIGPDDLAPLFPMALIGQEVSSEPWIDIPGPVADILRLWRPTPLVRARRMEEALGTPARIYYKDESVSPPGSHKPNTAVPQAFYNKEEGVVRLATETGAGQWGSALAFACGFFGIECQVYMVRASYEQKPYRRVMIETWDGKVVPSPVDEPEHPGSLGTAISDAVRDAATRDDTHYSLGSVLSSCPTLTGGRFEYDFGDTAGLTPLLSMYTLGHEFVPPPIHAGGLRYHGDAPIISNLVKNGRMEAMAYPQGKVFEAAVQWARVQGTIPAPETAHAVRAVVDEALAAKEENAERVILFNYSGHGLLDLQAYDDYLHDRLDA